MTFSPFRCFLGAMALLSACHQETPPPSASASTAANPVGYFEIPVTDLDRAVAFYTDVFGYDFERAVVDGYDMALFPAADGRGATGALAKGDVYIPSKEGVFVYFSVPDIDPILERAVQRGGQILYAKKSIGEAGYVAEIQDSEGNRIALQAASD